MSEAGVPTEKQAKDLDYCTPEHVLGMARAYFGGPIPLDPATNAMNTSKALNYFTPERMALRSTGPCSSGTAASG